MTQPDEELAAGDREHLEPEERDLEAPAADVTEQVAPVDPDDEPRARPVEVRRGLEVGEWDALEQSIVIDIDDEYDR